MNNFEDNQNIIELMKQALLFYAEPKSYLGITNNSVCYCGVSVSPVEIDEGHQARFALETLDKINNANQENLNNFNNINFDIDSGISADIQVDSLLTFLKISTCK